MRTFLTCMTNKSIIEIGNNISIEIKDLLLKSKNNLQWRRLVAGDLVVTSNENHLINILFNIIENIQK